MADYPPNMNPRNDSHPFDGDVPSPPWFLNGVPEPHKHHHRHDELVDRCADRCDDQLPLFSQVGRGLRGDGYVVECHDIDECTTKLEGFRYNAATNEYTSEWLSQNLNGGHLSYQYNLHPYGDPPTFTITFKYDRPEHPNQEWEWTTPAIPFVLDALGAGIGTLFIKKTTDPDWEDLADDVAAITPHDIDDASGTYEKLIYPENDERADLNAPLPGDPWTVNLEYGLGGDIDVPNIDDLAKIIGISPAALLALAAEQNVPTGSFGTGINVKEYIDNLDDHIHEDMGFGDILINDGDADTANPKRNTIKKWIDWLNDKIDDLEVHFHKDLGYNDPSVSGEYGGVTLWGDQTGTRPSGQNAVKDTVWKWLKFIIDQLGFGNDIDSFDGLSGVTTVKQYIKRKISQISDPVMYTQEVPVVFVLYELPTAATAAGLPAGTLGITDSTISPAPVYGTVEATTTSNSTIAGKLEISYYDVLPDMYVTFDFNIERSGKIPVIFSKPGHLIIACEPTQVNGKWRPLNLSGVELTHREGTVKKPVFYTENLSNSGYYADDFQGGHEGMFSVYTGIGNIAATDRNWDNNCRDWPWTTATPGDNGHFYAYLFDRYGGGSVDRILQIDGFRNYDVKFTQATKG